jgi:hypothetical protein
LFNITKFGALYNNLTKKIYAKWITDQTETNDLHLFWLAQHSRQNGIDEARLFELEELDF